MSQSKSNSKSQPKQRFKVANVRWNLGILMAFIASLAACNPSKASGTHHPTDDGNTSNPGKPNAGNNNNWNPNWGNIEFKSPVESSCVADSNNPLSCIAQACSNARGQFNAQVQSCNCGTDHYFTAYFGGHCLSMATPFETEAYTDFLLAIKNKSQKIPYLSLTATQDADNSQGLGYSEFGLVVNGSTNVNDVVNEFDAAAASPSSVSLPLIPAGTFQNKIFLGPNVSAKDLTLNLVSIETKLQGSPSSTPLLRNFVASSVREVGQIVRAQIANNVQIANPNSDDIKMQAAQMAFARRNGDWTQFDSFVNFSNDGCAGRCRLRKGIRLDLGGVTAFEEREVSGGVVLKDQILIFTTANLNTADVVIEIDPSGAPNLIYLLSTEQRDSIVQRLVNVYDRNWHSFGPAVNFALTTSDVPYSRNQADASSVVVCEDGFDLAAFRQNNLDAGLRFGPQLSSDSSQAGSRFGWLTNRNADLRSNLSGIGHYGLAGVPDRTQDLAKHAMQVTQVVNSNQDTSVIPMGVAQCFEQYADWKQNVRSTGARVVNLSYSFPLERDSCSKNSDFQKSILNPDHSFLWILSAGNDGYKDIDSSRIHNCPENLSPLPNLITVAAGENGGISDYSNSGKNFADIVADGHTKNGDAQGTSFAAPRVAHAAAELAKTFDLSPEKIRLSLLLGASIPGNGPNIWPMPVRSGGKLDETQAYKIAKAFKDDSSGLTSPEQILLKVRCGQSRDSCTAAYAQIKWLKESGILNR